MKNPHDIKIEDFHKKHEEANMASSLNRARSLTIGTCFNGVTEIMVRGNDGTVLWCPMQQFEVVELIHQLSANIGCHIALKPRDDFASWRSWRQQGGELSNETNNEKPDLNLEDQRNEQVVATQKTINSRTAERASKVA